MQRSRNLMSLVVMMLCFTVLLARDEIKSENDAKSVRGPDGKFTQIKTKDSISTTEKNSEKTTPKEKSDVLNAEETVKLKEKDGKQATVKGKVFEVYLPKSGSVAILNFGKDHRTCFKVAIFKANFEKFGGVEAISKNYSGKVVTVEGKLQIYQGQPEIVATVPSQLKIAE